MDPIPTSKWCTCVPTVRRDEKVYPPMTTRANWLPGWLCRSLLRESESQEGKQEVEDGVGYAGIERKKEVEAVVGYVGIEGKKNVGGGAA